MAERKEVGTGRMGDTAKRAILYVPGTGQDDFDQSASLVADRIARSLKRQQPSGNTFSYRIAVQRDQHHFVRDLSFDVATIEITSGSKWYPLIDVFELRYLSSLVQPFTALSPVHQGFKAMGMIAKKHLLRHRQSQRFDNYGLIDEAKAAFNIFVYIAFIIYGFYWAAIILAAILVIPNQFADIDLLEKDSLIYRGSVLLAMFLVLIKILFSSIIESHNKRRAIEYCSTLMYYNSQNDFDYIHNCLYRFPDIAKNMGYRYVDVLSVSFGSILAADVIYPKADQNRPFIQPGAITNWVTIGFPFDLMESQYPGYFGERQVLPASICPCWINVVVDKDLIGSKLQPDRGIRVSDGLGVRTPCKEVVIKASDLLNSRRNKKVSDIRVQNIGFMLKRVAPLINEIWVRLKTDKKYIKQLDENRRETIYHILYWDDEDPDASTCFDEIVKQAGWTDDLTVVA